MTPERFRQIVEAYGADPQRWPGQERQAAEAFAQADAEAQAVMARESTLDGLLGAYTVEPAGSALTARILASAGQPVRRALSWLSIVWRGAGLMGVGLAGAVAGALVVSTLSPMTPIFSDDGDRPVVTAFDAPAYDEVDDIP